MNEILLIGKTILFDQSEVLVTCAPDENWEKDFMAMGGDWKYENGWLCGTEPENKGGILFSKKRFDGNVMFSYTIKSKLPATRDLNGIFCADWDYEQDYLRSAYIAGLHGWYDHKAGIEKFPEDRVCALTPLYNYVPGEEVRITIGAVDGHCFMVVNDKLIMELIDDNPLLNGGHVGFSPYSTSFLVKDLEVRKIKWEQRPQSYQPEF